MRGTVTVWVVAGVLAILACAGCANKKGEQAPAPPGTCVDGVKNGNESGKDCGGSCGAMCMLGESCSAPDDCLFGVCSSGTCAAPSSGREPTGAVTAIIPPEGASLTVVTAERVAIELAFPAGAVTVPLEVTLTPQPLGGTGWLRVAVEPAGLMLSAPATVRVTLPASTPPAVTADGILRFVGPDDASVLPTTATGTTLEAPLAALGLPGFVGGPASVQLGTLTQALSLPSPASILEAIPMNLATRIALADGLLTVLRATGRYRDAVEVAGLMVTILSRLGDPAVEGRIRAFVDRAWATSCAAFTDATTSLQSNMAGGHPWCLAEAARFERPVVSWVVLLAKMEAYTTTACTNFSNGGWSDLVTTHMGRVVAAQKADILRMWRCDCSETPREEWTSTLVARCRTLGVGPRAPPTPLELPTTDDEWDHLADTVERAYLETDRLNYLGLPDEASQQRNLLADPHFQYARELAFAGCARDASQKPVAKLLAVKPGLAALREDGQYCATQLHVQHKDSVGGTVMEELSPALGAVDGRKQSSGTLLIAKSGVLSLTGPTAPLYCPQGATDGMEALVIKLDGTTLQRLYALPYLFTTLDLDVSAALEMAHPGSVAALNHATLTVHRDGVPCSGFWGDNPAPLLTLNLTLTDVHDRLVMHGTAMAGGGYVRRVSKVEPSATTELFSATQSPTLLLGQPYYLRAQRKLLVGIGNAVLGCDCMGWGYLGTAGVLDVVHPAVIRFTDEPVALSSNGKYRAHRGGVYTESPGPEGPTFHWEYTVRIYDNATDSMVEEFSPVDAVRTLAYLEGSVAVGPAGEVLYLATDMASGVWHIHRLGAGDAVVGAFPSPGFFGAGGDKVYLGELTLGLTEVVLATGATRSLPATGGYSGDVKWTPEAGGLIFFDRGDALPRQLHRLDLATGLVSNVGALPAGEVVLQFLVP